jgi:acyl-CoA thioester hydrolase
MVLSYQRGFKVRFSECDLYGHVNNAVYLHYLQEAQIEADAQKGCLPSSWADRHLQWWIERVELEYLQQLFYGETVVAAAGDEGFFQDSALRSYQLSKQGTSEAVGRGRALFRLRERDTHCPTPIPADLKQALFPGMIESDAPLVLELMESPSPPPGVFVSKHQIQDGRAHQHLDLASLMNLMGECGRQAIAAHGWPAERMLEERTAILLRRNQIDYHSPVLDGDEIEILTWVSDIKRATAVRHYRVQRSRTQQVLSEIKALGVWVNLDSGMPVRFSKEFLDDFEPNIARG